MSVRLNFNLAATLTQRTLSSSERSLTTAMGRLSSGVRIGRAADDPAGLVIADRMRYIGRALDQATANSEQGVSLLQTADGGMDGISTTLKNLRQLAVQAANEGVQDVSQLRALQTEFDDAVKSITQAASNTRFGNLPLLDGSMSGIELSDTASHDYATMTADATKLPAGITEGSTVTIGAPSANLTHEKVQVTLTNGASLAALSDPLSGLKQNAFATALTIAGSTSLTVTGPSGAQTLTLSSASTVGDLVGLVNAGTAATGVRASFDSSNGKLTLETVNFGAGTLSVASSDLTGGGNIGLLDTDTTSATANPLQAAPDRYRMLLDDDGIAPPPPATVPILGLTDLGPPATILNAVDGKKLTLFGRGTSAAMTMTGTTTIQEVVDWVNANGTEVGARADYNAVTGALSITGTRGPLVVSSEDMTSGAVGVGLLDRTTGVFGEAPGGTKISLAADATIAVSFLDASGTTRNVTLYQDPTSEGGLGFVNLTPGPELVPPYSGWEAGAIHLTMRDPTAGAFGATLTVPTAATSATRLSTAILQIGAQAGQDRRIEIPDLRAAALGFTAYRAEVASGASSKPLFEKGYRSLQDLVDGHALESGDADSVIRLIDAAIDEVSSARGRTGALQEHGISVAIDSLQISSQNLTAAESQIRDTDFAVESANVTRLQIMMQAATAMLAQASQVPQSVLQLLQKQ